MRAKSIAKRFQDEMIVRQRSEVDLENIRKVLRLKVEQHAEALRPGIELLATTHLTTATAALHGS